MNDDLQLIVVMGVSGTGKTTLARALAETWPAQFRDADDFHSPVAKARMARGVGLTDRMRAPWMQRICTAMLAQAQIGQRGVLAFSGLRRRHRDQLRLTGLRMRFLYLHGQPALIRARLHARQGHFSPPSLLASQFEALQEPDREADVIPLDMDATPAELLERALSSL